MQHIDVSQYQTLFKEEVKKEGPKIDHEFQEVCLELQPFYGRLVWTLPHKVGFTEAKIRKAHQIALSRGKMSFRYLVGVIKNLKPYEV